MTGFHEDQANYVTNSQSLVGQRRRVGGIGQVYKITSLLNADTALIHTEKTDEELPYPVAEALLDPPADEPLRPDSVRFAKLVDQYRTIGDCGPTYQVVSIVDETYAMIWIVPENDDERYRIEDILLDPLARD